MSPLDHQLVTRKKQAILQDLEVLSEVSNLTLEEYLGDYDEQLKAERLLEKIIGRLIDINYHVLKEEYNVVPQNYFESFVKMGELGTVDTELARQISSGAGLRNILVHEYDEIDSKIVFHTIQNELEQIKSYLSQV
jgi:uncharacterized protein YutE (UPF0331/DUF86 family)